MRIIELLIDKLEELNGFDAVALVEEPAIEADFFAFNNKEVLDTIEFELIKLAIKEQLVERKAGESKDDYIARCIPVLKEEGYADDQAAAICYDALKLNLDRIIQDGKPLYDTKEEAERVALEIGCEGSHEHEIDGKIWYMPCATHTETNDRLLELDIDVSSLPNYTNPLDEENYVFETYNDYPESAVNAAKRALEWKDEHPDNDCGTRVGWARANQLANRRNISEDTIARMASFARHLQHEDVPYSEGCGGLMVDAWGGRAGIEWAKNKLEKIRASKQSLKKNKVVLSKNNVKLIERFSKTESNGHYKFGLDEEQMKVIGPMLIPDKLILRVDADNNPYYVFFSKNTVKAIAEKAMKNKLIDVVNLEHDMDETINAYMTKSWLVEDTDNDLSNKYGMNLPLGTWVAEYQIEDKKVWEDIKAGVYKGFSIEGIFQNNIVNVA